MTYSKNQYTNYIKTHLNGRVSHDRKTIEKIACPNCGKKEAYTFVDNPTLIHCNRKSKCGQRTKLKDIAPELFNFQKDHPPTKTEPNAPAKAYLESRGLTEETLKKVKYKYLPNIKRGGKDLGPAVRSELPDKCWTARIFDPPEGEGKTHHHGKVGHKLWGEEYLDFKDKKPTIFLVEGIIDAMSMIQQGFNAMAYLSASYSPVISETHKDKNIVLMCDGDKAGIDAGIRIMEYLLKEGFKVQLAAPQQQKDCNDLLLENRLNQDEIERQLNRGQFTLAKSPEEYAKIHYDIYKKPAGIFEHSGGTWYSDLKKAGKGFTVEVSFVAPFTIRLKRVFIRDGEYLRELEISGSKGQYSIEVLAVDMVKSSSSKETISGRTPYSYTPPSPYAHDNFWRYILNQKYEQTIIDTDLYGYSETAGAFITPWFWVKGTQQGLAKDGISKIGPKYFRPLDPGFCITPEKCDTSVIYKTLIEAFPENAKFILGWWMALTHRADLLKVIGQFPFFSFYGPTSTGKTTLARILNYMFGLNNEGFGYSKSATTIIALSRNMSQYSGCSFNLLEGSSMIEADYFLPIYNGNAARSRGSKTNGKETQNDPCLVSLLFIQNREPFKNKAMKERVISVLFQKDKLEDTREASDRLGKISKENFCFFGVDLMTRMNKIYEQAMELYETYWRSIYEVVKDERISKNYALPAVFFDASGLGASGGSILRRCIELAEIKMQSLELVDESMLDVFYERIKEDSNCSEPSFAMFKGGEYLIHMKSFFSENRDLNESQIRDLLKDHGLISEKRREGKFKNGKIVKCMPVKPLKESL